MTTFISARHHDCLRYFHELLELLLVPDHRTLRNQLSEELDRYRIWAANLGVGFNGTEFKRSLDYRLKEAATYKEAVSTTIQPLKPQHRFSDKTDLKSDRF